MLVILSALLPLLLVGLLGSLFKATRIADDGWVTILNRYAMYAAFPAVIIHSLIGADKGKVLDMPVILLNAGLLLLVFLVALLVTRLARTPVGLANTYIIVSFFGNIGYLGFPYISAMIPGSEGMTSMHISIYNILLFTLGIARLEHSKGHERCKRLILKEIFGNPLLIAVGVGLALLITGLKLPDFLLKTFELLYKSATPVVLFALGIFMVRRYDWRGHLPHILGLSALRLLLVPGLFILMMLLFRPGANFQISVLQAGMPLALTPFALAEKYPLEREIIAPAILVSTLLSPLTLALFYELVR